MGNKLKFKFDNYQRHFQQPLRTSHGVWRTREGIIISLESEAGISQGEIAPLPWFGSETMSQALEFCQQLGKTVDSEDIAGIPDYLPACQFALESAWLNLAKNKPKRQLDNLDYCYLLPAGKKALTSWQDYQAATTFKWKIGVFPLATEIEILKQLITILPTGTKLRLDANGGLNLQQAKELLSVTDRLTAVEFVEQPLSPKNFTEILQLSREHTTPLALDESVASFKQLQLAYERGWRGIFVIKAAIMGFPRKIKQFCQANSLDVVLSSVFETKVGRNAVLNLAQELYHPRAVGFGVQYFY
ncbi:o-succinylbenzoate synthase [Pleurocapsales cyanobacterium LEGE 10410]|nr:o-succinylbenzoate synthase [Pleurocapsales cyanobacterium LEGE 10410]